MDNKILDFWNDQAKFGEMAGTKDLIAKQLEMKAIASYVKDGMRILDFGCGNGLTAFYLYKQFQSLQILGIDFSEEMIKEADKLFEGQINYVFLVGDVGYLNYLKSQGTQFDLIYTERTLINLKSWEEQKEAIEILCSLLAPNGKYIMCENSQDGLDEINEFRKTIDLPYIEKPWHNLYFKDNQINKLNYEGAKGFYLSEINYYSSTYYFLSRIMNAWFYHDMETEPQYNSDINQLALKLPALKQFGQGRIWVWVKK
jgi:ubiquinone/menaquinone biosynthesis C-methylase UbiE